MMCAVFMLEDIITEIRKEAIRRMKRFNKKQKSFPAYNKHDYPVIKRYLYHLEKYLNDDHNFKIVLKEFERIIEEKKKYTHFKYHSYPFYESMIGVLKRTLI